MGEIPSFTEGNSQSAGGSINAQLRSFTQESLPANSRPQAQHANFEVSCPVSSTTSPE